MKKILCVLGLALVLAGCKKPDASAPASIVDAPTAEAPPGASPARPSSPLASMGALLAYAYSLTIVSPAAQISALERKQEAACNAAGPALCQVLDEHLNASDQTGLEGELTLRAESHWLDAFRAGIEADARAAGGRIAQSSVATEDLTRQITDEAAALRTQQTLHDRLQAQLAQGRGKPTELTDLAKQVADIQGGLDTAQAELSVKRQLVQMSKLTIRYQTLGLARDSVFAPVVQSAHGVLGYSMSALAVLMTLAAFLAPFGAVLGLVLWLMGKAKRRRTLGAPEV